MKILAVLFILMSLSAAARACDMNRTLERTVNVLLSKESEKVIERGFPEQLEDDGGLIQTMMTVDAKTGRYTSWRVFVSNSCEATYEQF